jgi:hypothetical protein
MHSLNKRYLCPGGAPSLTKQGDELYISVYNPYHEDQEFVSIFLNTSKVQIFAWYPYQKSFQPAKAEAFCYPNPDKNTTYECEVYIQKKLTAWGVTVFKIVRDEASEIGVFSDDHFLITNDRIWVEVLTDSLYSDTLAMDIID